ncbi:uncharacterized protein LOC126944880 [Macaca thibetana thibetana]|uniref:uncharacterized protein LOC126944880 n=1 Tax=Macaca thibetana thibetana TaxID=257877 RepID=UPI0021BC5BF0|nr:uncharacterized protein LOC126944880 [Macaca thibetana thibetana]
MATPAPSQGLGEGSRGDSWVLPGPLRRPHSLPGGPLPAALRPLSCQQLLGRLSGKCLGVKLIRLQGGTRVLRAARLPLLGADEEPEKAMALQERETQEQGWSAESPEKRFGCGPILWRDLQVGGWVTIAPGPETLSQSQQDLQGQGQCPSEDIHAPGKPRMGLHHALHGAVGTPVSHLELGF